MEPKDNGLTSTPSRRRRNAPFSSLRDLAPRASDYAGLRTSWKADVVAGLTVGVVAVPLALAFGITTGLGADAGLITAIVAGLVAAVFGGSNVQVSGPTGAMTVVLVPIVARYGAQAVFLVSMLAGVVLIVAALARLGRYIAFIPWPVVEGFTIGIAVIIFLQQVPPALGVVKPKGDNTAVVAAKAVVDAFGGGRIEAIGVVALVAAIMVGVPRVRRSLPASLIAVAAATILAQVMSLDIARIGSLPSSLPMPSLPHTSVSQIRDLLSAGVAVALLASIESLLSARVADGMSDGARYNPDRELFGQGLANVVSPLFGGMPATGAIARTAVNVRAGARTRVAAVTHAVVLMLVVFFGGRLVSEIPLAALAGVLMATAIRMVEIHNVRAVLRSTRSDALVLVLTAAATIAFDLIVAVEVGVAVAVLLALRHVARNSGAEVEALALDETVTDVEEARLLHEHIVVYRLDGAMFFGAAQRFLTELTAVSDVKIVILRLSRIQVLDATGAQALGEIVAELESRGITVLLKGMRPQHRRVLEAVGTLDHLAHEHHLFDTLDDAVTHARLHLART
ncbi:MAG: sulfate permease, SulP family [Ilumatobacteraceae bacterium]